MLLLLAAALAQTPAPPPAPAGAVTGVERSSPTVRLVYTGDIGGIGSGHYRFDLLDELPERIGVDITSIATHHGALVQGDAVVVTEDRTVASMVAFLEGSAITCGDARMTTMVWTPAGGAFLPEGFEGADALDGQPVWVRTCTNDDGDTAISRSVSDAIPASWAPEDFEVRVMLTAETADGDRVEVVGKAANEPARRMTALADLAADGALFVDAGNFIDGVSTVTDAGLSLHRETGLDVLRRLNPTALVPGYNELVGGLKRFEADATGLPYVATNWRSESMSLPRVVEVEQEGVRIAFLGIVPPTLVDAIPSLKTSDLSLIDPFTAVEEALEGVDADLVVVLTTESVELTGLAVDLVVGEPRTRGLVEAVVWDMVEEPGRLDTTAPIVAPLDGISTIDAWFDDDPRQIRLRTLEVRPQRTGPDVQPDPDVQRAITRVRLQTYPEFEDVLLPTSSDDALLQPMSDATWDRIACEALRSATRADLVFLPDFPEGSQVPGPQSELLALDRLATLDHVEVHHVPGDRYQRLVTKAFRVVPVSCGTELGASRPKARGRSIESNRLYRVVTTERARLDPILDGLLAESRSPLVLDKPGIQPLKNADGEPLTLRRAVLGELRSIRDDKRDPRPVLTARSSSDKPPMWLLRVQPIALRVERFQGVDDDAYADIPETLATSPSSFTIGGTLNTQLDYSSPSWLTTFDLAAAYQRLVTDEDAQETADDLRFSVNGALPMWSFDAGLTWMPFGELLLDSEFTPVEGADAQFDGYVLAGLAAGIRGPLKRLRVGGFAHRHLAIPDKATEYGGRLEGDLTFTLGPQLAWSNRLDAYVYASAGVSDASDLRFKSTLDSRLSLPVSRFLAMSLYGQLFAFSGRVEATRAPAASWTTGAALDLNGVFELGRARVK